RLVEEPDEVTGEAFRQVGAVLGGFAAATVPAQVRADDTQPFDLQSLDPPRGFPIHLEVSSETVQEKHRYCVRWGPRAQIRITHYDVVGEIRRHESFNRFPGRRPSGPEMVAVRIFQ